MSVKKLIPVIFLLFSMVIGGLLGMLRVEVFHVFIFFSLIVAVVSVVWMHYLVGLLSLRCLTIPAVFYWMFFLRIYIPAHWIVVEDSGVTGRLYLLAVWSVLLLIPAGISWAKRLMRHKLKNTKLFVKSLDLSLIRFSSVSFFWIVFLFFMSLFVMAVHIRLVPSIPILEAFGNSGEARRLALMREESVKLLRAPVIFKYFIRWTRDIFLPLLVMLSWGKYALSRKQLWLIVLITVFVLGLFYNAMDLMKGSVANFLLAILIFYWLLFKRHLSFRFVIIGGGLVFLYPLLVNFLKYGDSAESFMVMELVKGIVDRTFYITALMPYLYFKTFPLSTGFLMGRSIGLWAFLTGQEYFNTPNYVYHFASGGYIESGYSNAAFIGDLYADFGFLGIFVGTFILGFFLQILQIFMERQARTVWTVALYTLFCVSVTNLVSTSISITILTGGIIPLIGMAWMNRFLEKHRQIRVHERIARQC